MNDILKYALETVIGLAVTGITAFVVSYLKKGGFKNWGITCGKALSKFAGAKIGANRWEKMEDVITVSIVSFATGFKEGADYDDAEIKVLMADKNKIGKLNDSKNSVI